METMNQTQINTLQYKVSENLYLVTKQIIDSAPAKPVETDTNHILVVDCSGSMYGEISKVRDHIKNKLPKLMKEKDTLSIIWFSGKGQFGTLIKGELIATLNDLADVNKQIDRWLKPMGLTGFKEPIEEVGRLTQEIGNGNPFSLFFMSDGCDNQWSKAEILKAIEATGNGLASATFVEYGYYADRPMLTSMAEKCGGQLIFSDGFGKFSPFLDAAIQKQVVGGKKVEVAIGQAGVLGGMVFAIDGKDLLTFEELNGLVTLPEHIKSFSYLSDKNAGGVTEVSSLTVYPQLYAAISLFSVRMKPQIVKPLLKASGDVRFINLFSGCFGKQRYSDFQEATKEAVSDPGLRLAEGYDPTLVPPDDAFTIVDFLQLLQMNENNQVLLNHNHFVYNRIGRNRVDSNLLLSKEEGKELKELTESMAGLKDISNIRELSAKMQGLLNKPEPLKFVESYPDDIRKDWFGYSVNNLVFNQDRPNVSIQIRKEGQVDLSARLAGNFPSVPSLFKSYIFRNYTIIKDGLVNVEVLPVRLEESTRAALAKAQADGKIKPGFIKDTFKNDGDIITIVNLQSLPIINAKMTKEASAKKLFEKTWELTKAQASQKVFNSFKKLHFPEKESKQFEQFYGKNAAQWLADQGITDYSGFSPKVLQTESTDVYMAKVLKVSIKGYSTIPSLNAYKTKANMVALNTPELKKQAAFTPSELLMKPAVDECEEFLASDIYKDAMFKEEILGAWLKGKAKKQTELCRALLFEIAQIKFSVIVGQVWFTEFASLDENKMTLNVDGLDLACTVEMLEVEEKI